MIDIHSHILPGVDDGARDLGESVGLVQELAESGVTDIVATPHYVAETKFASERKTELRLLSDLRKALLDEGVNVKVFLGNEIYIDKSIASLIKEGKISAMAESEYLLVELPMNSEFPNYEDILSDLMSSGYKVILAHPERYSVVQKDFGVLNELSDLGMLFQCNLGSIMGEYGKNAKKIVKKMMKGDLVFAFGSDMHYRHGEEYWMKAQKRIAKYFTKGQVKRVFETNPRKVLKSS